MLAFISCAWIILPHLLTIDRIEQSILKVKKKKHFYVIEDCRIVLSEEARPNTIQMVYVDEDVVLYWHISHSHSSVLRPSLCEYESACMHYISDLLLRHCNFKQPTYQCIYMHHVSITVVSTPECMRAFHQTVRACQRDFRCFIEMSWGGWLRHKDKREGAMSS